MINKAAILASPMLDGLAKRCVAVRPALLGMGTIVLGATLWALSADRLSAELPKQVYLPEVPGWQRTDYAPQAWWEPRASGADHRLLGRYSDGQGRTVDVFFALYSGQSEGREAGGFGEGALTPESEWAWLAPGSPIGEAKADRLLARGEIERSAFTWYRSGDLLTGSNAQLKLANMKDRLLLRARPTAMLILSSEKTGTSSPDEAVRRFQSATGPVDAWMDRVGGIR